MKIVGQLRGHGAWRHGDAHARSNLAPVRYDGRYSAPGQSINVTVAVASNGATVTSPLATTSGPLQLAPGTTHFAIVEPGLLAGLFALPAQLNAWKESRVTWISPTSASSQFLSVGTAQRRRDPRAFQPMTRCSRSIVRLQ